METVSGLTRRQGKKPKIYKLP